MVRRLLWGILPVAAVALVAGCTRDQGAAAPKVESSPSVVGVTMAQPASAPTSAAELARPEAAGPPAEPGAPPSLEGGEQPVMPKLCEVEITGKVSLPAEVSREGKYLVYVSDADCLGETTRILDLVQAADPGVFFLETFVRCGVTLTICASMESPPRSATEWYGKAAGEFPANKDGENEIDGLDIRLAKGPIHRFPDPIPSTQR